MQEQKPNEPQSAAVDSSQGCSIYISNIANAVTEDTLRKFFSFCGPIKSLQIVGPAPLSDTKYCIVEFSEPEAASTALLLTGTPLLYKEINVSSNPSTIPSNLDKPQLPSPVGSPVPAPAPITSTPGTSAGAGLLPTPPVNPLLAALPALGLGLPAIPPLVPDLSKLVPPPAIIIPPPNPNPLGTRSPPASSAAINAQKADEVARTVYVGNLNSQITADQLVKFFSVCGPISFCRMAGDDSHPARFAFIEFEHISGAQAAMAFSGTLLVDRPIKVNHSKNPIVKPPPKPVDSKKEEDLMRALRKATEALNKKFTGIYYLCCGMHPRTNTMFCCSCCVVCV
jgi:arginine/serine-rich splicing factor 12